jgi:hypothetical protein
MRTLYKFLLEEIAAPSNTMGMGNVSIETDPLVIKKKNKKTRVKK